MESIIVCLIGAQASGKSTLERWIDEDLKIPRLRSHTTRPKRITDRDDEYYFIDNEHFNDLKWLDGGFIETREYTVADGTVWQYGLHATAVNAPVHILVIDYVGFCELRKHYITLGIHIDITREESFNRIKEFRPSYPMDEAIRRFDSDVELIQIPARRDPLIFQMQTQDSVTKSQEEVRKFINLATRSSGHKRTLTPVGSKVFLYEGEANE